MCVTMCYHKSSGSGYDVPNWEKGLAAAVVHMQDSYNKEGSREKRYDEVLQRSRCESDMPGDVLVAGENAHFTSTSLSFPFLLINFDPSRCNVASRLHTCESSHS